MSCEEGLADAFLRAKQGIEDDEGSLRAFVVDNGLRYFGITRHGAGLVYREWAPAAASLSLVGDFNRWEPGAHPCARDARGVWELHLPDVRGRPAIPHGSRFRALVGIRAPHGVVCVQRVPAWAQRTTRDERSGAFAAVHVDPSAPGYAWRHARPPRPPSLRIYEAHVGMSSAEARISSWADFRTDVLPRIAALGYNALQLMAVQEHGCYESFGYHVTSFFAPACRFGPPDELRRLVDCAHGLGLLVLLDLVHSHASPNAEEGLAAFDGPRSRYFHAGARGLHGVWGSVLFDYGQRQVLRFLLANLAHWARGFRFDGFRFDAVSTMLRARGADGEPRAPRAGPAGAALGPGLDVCGAVYLMLANHALHEAFDELGLGRPALTVAEECSGHRLLCAPPLRGGLGFDFRLGLGLPPLWAHVAAHAQPGRWPLRRIASELCRRRPSERTIAYAECHDQCLVGGRTLACVLLGEQIHSHMSALAPLTPALEWGLAALKLVRLLTSGLGGDGYLNFMGNEWGHPEWVDFPREGNGHSLERARRRWDLADDPLLRYRWLAAFDAAMNAASERHGWLHAPHAAVLCADESAQLLAFERGGLLFAANTHPHKAVHAYALPLSTSYSTLVLSTDDAAWGGRSRAALLQPGSHAGEALLSLPAGCAFVLARSDHERALALQPAHGAARGGHRASAGGLGRSAGVGEGVLVTPLLG